MSAVEQLQRDAAAEETEIATEVRERFLREYQPTAADLLDGGATLRERIRVAQQSAEQAASDLDGARRDALIALAEEQTLMLAAYETFLPLLANFTYGISAARHAYRVRAGMEGGEDIGRRSATRPHRSFADPCKRRYARGLQPPHAAQRVARRLRGAAAMTHDPKATADGGFYVTTPQAKWKTGPTTVNDWVGFRIEAGTPLSDVVRAVALLDGDPDTVEALTLGNPEAREKAYTTLAKQRSEPAPFFVHGIFRKHSGNSLLP